MFTFLKEEYKKKVVGEYRRRLLASSLVLGLLLSLILLGLALPTYISLKSQKEALIVEREVSSKKLEDSGQVEIENQVKSLRSMIASVKADAAVRPAAETLEQILLAKGAGISIGSISFERRKDGWAISMGGVALSREALVEFSKRLEMVQSFSNIDLPVASLAKNKDIPFSIALRSKF